MMYIPTTHSQNFDVYSPGRHLWLQDVNSEGV